MNFKLGDVVIDDSTRIIGTVIEIQSDFFVVAFVAWNDGPILRSILVDPKNFRKVFNG